MSNTRKPPARSRAFTARSTLSVLVAAATSQPSQRARPAPRSPSSNAISGDERHRMISRLAYGYAERAGFASDPLSDWLAAEQEIDSMLAKAS